jgi:hypothetical protein
VQEGVGGKTAGDLAGGGPSDAIADDEGAVLGKRGAGVLIGVAHTARIGEHGEGAHWRGCRGRSECGSGWDLRLERFQSRSVRHFGTQDRRFPGSLKQYSLGRERPITFVFGVVWLH